MPSQSFQNNKTLGQFFEQLYVSDPPYNRHSFNEGKGDGNLTNWGIKPHNSLIGSEVPFDFFNEVICFGIITGKDLGKLSYSLHIGISWHSLLWGSSLSSCRWSCSSFSTTTTIGLSVECTVEGSLDFIRISRSCWYGGGVRGGHRLGGSLSGLTLGSGLFFFFFLN